MKAYISGRSRSLVRGLLTGALMIACLAAPQSSLSAYAAAPPPPCARLSAQLSDDKNYYAFTATTTLSGDDITGYTFDFGDFQSYSFNLDHTPAQDRQIATVTHTYIDSKGYTAAVSVLIKGGAPSSASLPQCKATVSIGSSQPTGMALPNTGPGNMVGLFAAAVTLGTSWHHFLLRTTASSRRRI